MLRASTAAAISHQAVHVHRTFRPETYPVFAGNVGGRFCSTEEFPGDIAHGLQQQPSFNGHSARKRQGREHRFVKGNYLGEPSHTQINVGERLRRKNMANPILVTWRGGPRRCGRAHGHRTAVEARQSGACDGAK